MKGYDIADIDGDMIDEIIWASADNADVFSGGAVTHIIKMRLTLVTVDSHSSIFFSHECDSMITNVFLSVICPSVLKHNPPKLLKINHTFIICPL